MKKCIGTIVEICMAWGDAVCLGHNIPMGDMEERLLRRVRERYPCAMASLAWEHGTDAAFSALIYALDDIYGDGSLRPCLVRRGDALVHDSEWDAIDSIVDDAIEALAQ